MTKRNWGKNFILLAGGAVGALLASSAYAGMAAPAAVLADNSVTSSGTLAEPEEIVVTAQKRAEKIQDVPISMTAFSPYDLAGKAVERITDLQYAAPALTITNAGLTESVNIRGIGLSSGSPNAANGVATYVDGLFQPPIVSTGTFYDIADIEVLRGPQGTFVGSNSTGGAIFIKSKDPKLGDFGGKAEISGGGYGAIGFEGAINVPVIDTLAVRVAIDHQDRDSYDTDHGPYHNKADRLAEGAGRVGVLWTPLDNFQALLKIEALDRNTGGYAYQPAPGTAYASQFSEPTIRDIDYNAPTLNHEKAQQAGLTMQYVLDNGITIKSITGDQNKKINNKYDTDGTATVSNTENQFVRERVETQEIDVLSPTDGPFSWITGGYAQRNRIDVIIHNGPFPTDILIGNKKTTLGLFGQAGYQITPDIVFTLGARYSHYEVAGTGSVHVGNGLPGFPAGGLYVANTGGHETDGRPTGKANVDWHLDPDNMFYAFVARGYKSGGLISPGNNFAPETVWDYEAGWKSTLFDGHLKTQLDGFYNDYKNFQFDTVNTVTGQSAVQNASSATIKGVEASAQGKLNGFGYDASVAYIDSQLAPYKVIDQNLLPPGSLLPQCASGQTTGCTDYSHATKIITGASNLLSPKVTFTAGIEYGFSASDAVRITPRLNYSYTSGEDASPSREKFYHIAGHGLVSTLVTVDYDRWSLQFYGTNLTDEKYISGFIISGSAGVQFYGPPRSFGARLSADF